MDNHIAWFCHPFDGFTLQTLYQALRFRDQVFVLEQQSIYGDLDNADQDAWHIRGVDAAGELLAYARLLPPGTKSPDAVGIGRVVIHADGRGKGYGKQLMAVALEQCALKYADAPVVLSAQTASLGLYQSFGFVTVGEQYDDGGVMHVDMRRD